MKIQQAARLVTAGCIGYFISFITMQLPGERCNNQKNQELKYGDNNQKCPVCKPFTSLEKSASSINCSIKESSKVLHQRFRPKSMYEVIQYDHFNKKSLFNSFYEEPKHGLLRHEKEDILDILNQVLVKINKKGKISDWKLKQLVNGYRRLDPLRGEEYILDIEILSKSAKSQLVHVDVVKPFESISIVKHEVVTTQQKINFILPIARVGDRFLTFVNHFEEVCLKSNENVALLVVLFINEKDQASTNLVRTTISKLKKKYQKSELIIIETKKEFSRGFGLDFGIEHVQQNDLVYFCDVDVKFTVEFLSRCRSNAIQHEQVYYPLVFAQYDPSIVQAYSPKKKFKSLLDITKYTGHWVHYAYGMVCMYKSDYTAVGGFNLHRQGWGGEDVELYTKHAKSNFNVFRAMDPGLIHIFHSKTCDKKLSHEQYEMCVQSAGESLGSRQQLGKLLLQRNLLNSTSTKKT